MDKKLGEVNIPELNEYQTENEDAKTTRLFKKNPSLLLGLVGGLGGLAYMAKQFTQRGNMKPSVYLIHTRLLVQTTVVGSLAGAMLLGLYQQGYQSLKNRSEEKILNAKKEMQNNKVHRINWPTGGYESKPGPGIIYTEFGKSPRSTEEENNI